MNKILSYIKFIIISILFIHLYGCSMAPGGNTGGGTSGTSSAGLSDMMKDTNKIQVIMVYLDADNNLESYGLDDFNEMEAGLNNPLVKVIVLFDRSPGYDTSQGNWTGARLYEVLHDPFGFDSTIRSKRLSGTINGVALTTTGNNQDLNMGDGKTLSDFVDFVEANYPSQNYMLILWDHGDGWRSSPGNLSRPVSNQNPFALPPLTHSKSIPEAKSQNSGLLINPVNNDNTLDPLKGACVDESSGNDRLYNSEIRAALAGKGIKVLGFDACYMGMIEAAYEFKDVAEYMIASADTEPGDGWEYDVWLSRFCGTSLTVAALATNIINSYKERYADTCCTTLAAYDLSKINNLKTAFDAYTAALSGDLWNPGYNNTASGRYNSILSGCEVYYGSGYHIDLYDLADTVNKGSLSADLKNAVNAVVAYEWHHSGGGDIYADDTRSHGMAVYFGTTTGSGTYLRDDYAFSNFTLFNQDSAWDTYLADLYGFPPYEWITANSIKTGNIPAGGEKNYQVYVSAPGSFSVDLYNFGANDFDLYMYDGSGNYADSSLTVNPAERIVHNSTTAGWYVIRVYSFDGAGPFNLVVSNQDAVIK